MIKLKDLKELLGKINDCDEEYYNNNNSLLSDFEYDMLKDQLRTLTSNFDFNTKASESILVKIKDALTRVGAPPPKNGKWKKIEHEVVMNSLNKAQSVNDFESWVTKCNYTSDFLICEKLDGISISLKYENGNFVQALTRGDSIVGEDITRNVKKMKFVPLKLNTNFTGHVRGEILLFHSDWRKYLPEMANPRNAASGIAKRIDGQDVERLSVLAYTVEGQDFQVEENIFAYLLDLGFKTPNYITGDYNTVIKTWKDYIGSTRQTLDYDIDGLVIRINNRSAQFALGEENHRPKGSIAFKFESPEATTIITNIICQVGDSGQVTPVAEFDEVILMGAKIKKASLHNFTLVQELGVQIGSNVIVSRRNDVIPYVEKVLNKTNDYFKAPKHCPICNSELVKSGEYIKCQNKNCHAKVIGRLNKWIGELGILEWGEAILNKLIETNLVNDVPDLYKLTIDDLSNLERFGQKSAENLIQELNKFRNIPLENLIGGLSIDGIATSTAKLIINAGYDTLSKIYNLTIEQLGDINGLGYVKASSFYNGIKENKDRIENILISGVNIKEKIKGSLSGNKIAITGTLSLPRKELQNMITAAGGEVDKSVGKNTTYLIIADTNSTSSKAQAARKLGITLISEQQLFELINS
jgi:DNA ligase (NAD+)